MCPEKQTYRSLKPFVVILRPLAFYFEENGELLESSANNRFYFKLVFVGVGIGIIFFSESSPDMNPGPTNSKLSAH